MTPFTVIWLLAAHFVADFVFQTTKTGLNKSSNNRILATHVAIYTCVLAVLMVPLLGMKAVLFAVTNGLLHFPTDYISSRLAGKYHREGRLYAFWKVIGLDQLAHYIGLILLFP